MINSLLKKKWPIFLLLFGLALMIVGFLLATSAGGIPGPDDSIQEKALLSTGANFFTLSILCAAMSLISIVLRFTSRAIKNKRD
jgi:hypothetical protein